MGKRWESATSFVEQVALFQNLPAMDQHCSESLAVHWPGGTAVSASAAGCRRSSWVFLRWLLKWSEDATSKVYACFHYHW